MFNLITQKMEQIKEKLPSHIPKEAFSEQQMEVIRQSQHIACFPELFRQLLLLLGEIGLGSLFFREGPFERLENLKEQVVDLLEAAELDYPEDLFFFHGNHVYDVYLCFRTRDCEADPPVYSVGAHCFFREADTLSEYILGILDPNQKTQSEHRQKKSKLNYYYNPNIDEFYNLAIPAEPAHRLEKAREIIIHRYRSQLIGCNEAEIEILKQDQAVTCCPDVYHEILLLMGKSGLEWVFYGRTTYEFLKSAKDEFAATARHEAAISYPQDIFIFLMDHKKRHFGFFRTKDCNPDPAVYGYEGQNWFYKYADTLSEFLLQELDPNSENQSTRRVARLETIYSYDLEQDDFMPLTSPH